VSSKQVAPAERPDVEGTHGRAWRVTHPREAEDYPTSLKGWLVYQPRSHPFWSWYMVGGVALRDEPGVSSAHKQFAAATHEFLIAALDPTKPLPMIHNWRQAAYMRPLDLVHQIELPNDYAAQEILDLIVERACTQGVQLDEDNRRWWQGSLDTTAQHYREGVH
jgi:hypothetical protein